MAIVLPKPTKIAAVLPAGADLGVPGLSPFTTPNRDFYRIDVELTVPRYSAKGWTLDSWGGLHPFGSAPALDSTLWGPQYQFRGLSLTP